MQTRLIPILMTIIVLLVGALAFMLGRQTAPTPSLPPIPALTAKLPASTMPAKSATARSVDASIQHAPALKPLSSSTPMVANAGELVPIKGAKPYVEQFEDVSLRFVPTKTFRKMIEYRTKPLSDSSCTKVYTKRETVRKISYAWGFVIQSFTTWNAEEGQQEYMVDETSLPNAFQGSLHDIVREGRIATVDKQRCGQGQVEGLVAIR